MRKPLSLLLFVSAAMSCHFLFPNSCMASPAAEGDVLAANSGFYAALNNVFNGDAKAMDQVWSHSKDVSYMGPDGLRHLGWDAVRTDWGLLASKLLGGTAELTDIRVQPGDSMAAVSGLEVGDNLVNGKPQRFSIRATNIFRKEGGKWKMVAHHTDKLPYLGK